MTPHEREVMQQALDALEQITPDWRTSIDKHEQLNNSIEALRTALAQPEPEPVAWWHDRGDVVDLNVSGHGTPLYFAPPQREWVGLTDDEKHSAIWTGGEFGDGMLWAEKLLKEKNT